MNLARHWLKKRILPPVFLATVVVVALALYIFDTNAQRQLLEDLSHDQQSLRNYWSTEVIHHRKEVEALLQVLTGQPEIAEALDRGDPAWIQGRSHDLYETLSRDQHVDRMAIADARGRILFQHQAPGKPDALPEVALNSLPTGDKPLAGIAIGPSGIGIRGIQSVRYEGKQVGYLMLGESFSHLLDHLEELYPVKVCALLDKSYIERQAPTFLSSPTASQPDWSRFPRYLLLSHDNCAAPAPIEASLQTHQFMTLPAGEVIETNDAHAYVGTLPLEDASGERFGYLLTVHDFNRRQALLDQTLLKFNLLAAAVASTLLAFLFWVTRRAEHQFRTTYTALATSHHALDEAHREWEEAFDTIEDPVFLHDREFRITRANQAYARRAGLPFKEILGRRYWEVYPPMAGPLPLCQAAIAENGAEPGVRQAETVRLEDGTVLLSRSFSSVDKAGHYRDSIHILEDQTELHRVSEALQRENRARRLITEVNQQLAHSDSEESLLQGVCDVITQDPAYPLAWVGYREQDPELTIRPIAHAGIGPEQVGSLILTWADVAAGRNPAGDAIRSGETVRVQDIEADCVCEPCKVLAREVGYTSLLAFPLSEGEVTFGALIITAREGDAFTEEETLLFQELADDLNYGISALRSREAGRQARTEREALLEKLETVLDKTVLAMASAVEARDPYTAGHQHRVAKLAADIARELGLPAGQVEGIRIAATIHDIGKLNVPAELLSKPSRLTPLEFELIKGHAELGYQILKDIDFPWPVAEMVRQHHERLDGSGYPLGLKDGEILLEARIIGVADVVEAMASHRPYRAALGLEAALGELDKGSGTRYDTKVVEACRRLFLEKNYSL